MQAPDGLVVKASVVARLFGIRLLAIEAGVVVSPARLNGRAPAVAPRTDPRSIGTGLPAACRVLDEAATSLAASRAIRRRS